MIFNRFAGIVCLGLFAGSAGEGLADRIRLGDAMSVSQGMHVLVALVCLFVGAVLLSPKS